MQDRFKFRFWCEKTNKYENCFVCGVEGFQVSHVIPEQCTGLKDKNGKLIYEGDIVDYNNDIAEVFFCEAIACFGFTLQRKKYTDYAGDICRLDIYTVNCEVIGNIHENTDLLGE